LRLETAYKYVLVQNRGLTIQAAFSEVQARLLVSFKQGKQKVKQNNINKKGPSNCNTWAAAG
jgi:hypothetical protein